MSNTKNFLWRPDACKALAREILEDLADALVAAAASDDKFEPSAVDFGAYAGRYALPGDVARLDVRVAAGGLRVTLLEVPDFPELLAPVGLHAFCFASDPKQVPMLSFDADTHGQVADVSFLNYRFRHRAVDQPTNR